MKKLLFFLSLLTAISCVNAQSVSILGDSYSTFEGYVQPSTNEMWYYEENGWQVINEGGFKLCQNNSYSGSTIGYKGYDGNDYSARSFLTRMDDLGCPDILFIFGATNDSWAGEPVGEYKYEGWTKADFYTFRPAMAYMLYHIKRRYPNVHIYFLLNNELREDITSSCIEICRHYQIPCIQLQDIDKINGHPSVKGMKSISQQILKRLKEDKVID